MPLPHPRLANQEKIGKLKAEPTSRVELEGLMRAGHIRLQDAQRGEISADSRFTIAYDAAHSFALAALRWHGYRSKDRYLVFQVPEATLGVSNATWMFLANCHQIRNSALYDGDIADDEQRIQELIETARQLESAVRSLPAVGQDPRTS